MIKGNPKHKEEHENTENLRKLGKGANQSLNLKDAERRNEGLAGFELSGRREPAIEQLLKQSQFC
ncbi:Uncharacterised protein [Providencia stuartii]|nr:Uncharacterised protein [Providencia stuartii]